MIRLNELSGDEMKALTNIAKALSYFARERAYGYIDRLANAFSTNTVRQVLSEAIRDLKSEYDRGANVFMPKGSDVEIVLRLSERDPSILKVVSSLAIAYGWGGK